MLGVGGGLTHSAPIAKDLTDYTSLTGGATFFAPYTNNAPFNDSYTISLWFKTSDGRQNAPDGNSHTRYFCTVDSDQGTESAIYFGITPDGKIYVAVASGLLVDGSNLSEAYLLTTSDDALANGAVDWTHIAATVVGGGGSNTVVAIYINGEVSGVTTTGNTLTSTNHDAFVNDNGVNIGVLTTYGVVNAGKGIHHGAEFIDDFAIHDAALDATTIEAMYNSGTPIDLLTASGSYASHDNVVLYYRFNGKYDGNALLDSHGTQNASLGYGTQFSTESAT